MFRTASAALALCLASCGGPSAPGKEPAAAEPAPAAVQSVEPAPPGSPGGLPDDRSPVSEAPFAETSAQGAANVVQTYYALIEARKYDEAFRLRSDGGGADRTGARAFAKAFADYSEYHAQVGAPGEIEGAAGSLYVTVPVQVYGRTADGKEFREAGTVTLRRVNDVPGSTPEQRKWRISAATVGPGKAPS